MKPRRPSFDWAVKENSDVVGVRPNVKSIDAGAFGVKLSVPTTGYQARLFVA
jgi:hypothetical protein